MDKFVTRSPRVQTTLCPPETEETTKREVPSTAEAKLIANNRGYLKSVGNSVKFWIYRGIEHFFSEDVFCIVYQLALKKDATLTDMTDLVPPDAKYTNELFRMSVIRTQAQMVLSGIGQKYGKSDSKSFAVKASNTRDAVSGENLSILVRFVTNAKPEEHLIGNLHLEQNNADYIADRVLSLLTECHFTPQHIVSQCYDGTSLMSGCDGGVQPALQRKLTQYIPNVHSDHGPVSHLLADALAADPTVKNLFNTCDQVLSFLQNPVVSQRYGRPFLESLLHSQLDGRSLLTKKFVENLDSIPDLLSHISRDAAVPDELRVKASHLLPLLEKKYLRATGKFVLAVLQTPEPTVAPFLIVNEQEKYLPFSAEATLLALRRLENMCDYPENLAEYYSPTENLLFSADTIMVYEPKQQETGLSDSTTAATVRASESDEDSSESESSESGSSESGLSDCESHCEADRESYYEAKRFLFKLEQRIFGQTLLRILNLAIAEIKGLLPQENLALLEAIAALFPSSPCFLDVNVCLPLLDVARVSKSSLALELQEATRLLRYEIPTNADLAKACQVVHRFSATFPALYEMYLSALLMAIPVTDCKGSFPKPLETFALRERESYLGILAHESEILASLCMDEFVKEFSLHNTSLLL